MKTKLNPIHTARPFRVRPLASAKPLAQPGSGRPERADAELQTGSRRPYRFPRHALLALLAALCWGAPCAHGSDGTLVSWGYDAYGQVSGTPTNETFSAVAAGHFHSVAVRTDGTLVSWGWDNFGQVSGTPSGSNFTAVAAGAYHSVALRTDGTLVSWGWDIYGQVSGMPSGTNFTAVAAGGYHSVALRTDKTLVSWGYDGIGQVSGTPTGATFSAVAAGAYHSVAIRSTVSNHSPVAQCHDVTVSADADCSASASIDNGSSDPDAGDTITVSQSPAGPYPLGSTLVTLTVTDSHGASSSCAATVTVVDDTAPSVVSCPTDTTLECPATPAFGTPQFSDTCDNNLIATSTDTSLPVSGKEISKTRRTWTAADHSGNSVSCSQTITVVDTTAPTLTCPTDVTVITTSASGMVMNYPAATASDNCSTPTITYSKAGGSMFNLGTTTVTVTATDAKGNSAQCTFKVNVIYSWSGLLQPINADGSSIFPLASTVAVKFQLTAASTNITNALAKLSYTKRGDTPPGAVNEPTSTAAATTGNLFRYDSKTKQYLFNWGTKGLTAGTYQLRVDLGDGVLRTVNVGLK